MKNIGPGSRWVVQACSASVCIADVIFGGLQARESEAGEEALEVWKAKREKVGDGERRWELRMIAGQQEGPAEASGVAFEARAVSRVLLPKAVFSPAGVVAESGRARFSKVGLCRKYIKRGGRGLGTEGVSKGWMMVLTWMLVLNIGGPGMSAGRTRRGGE